MPASNQPYVPLWCKSNYSFLEGASHPAELVDACRQNGMPAGRTAFPPWRSPTATGCMEWSGLMFAPASGAST